jgi:hypothetical protein
MEQTRLPGQFRSCDAAQRDEVEHWGETEGTRTRILSPIAIYLLVRLSTYQAKFMSRFVGSLGIGNWGPPVTRLLCCV